MSTSTLERLPWDTFLEREAERRKVPEVGRTEHLRRLRLVIADWKSTEWSAIVRQLNNGYNWQMPEGLEPHWVAPGRAVFWQEQQVRQAISHQDSAGRTYKTMEERSQGWEPTSPLPANSASVMAAHLKKGLRLRPPDDGVGVELLAGLATPVEEAGEPSVQYTCQLHSKGDVVFPTWKGYARHCAYYKEQPKALPPTAVTERASEFEYYCYLHDQGWINRKAAERHFRNEVRKPQRGSHISLQEMYDFPRKIKGMLEGASDAIRGGGDTGHGKTDSQVGEVSPVRRDVSLGGGGRER